MTCISWLKNKLQGLLGPKSKCKNLNNMNFEVWKVNCENLKNINFKV